MDTSELSRKELLDFASSHLVIVQDEALLVLKAHLVAESLLYEILDDVLPNAAILDTARFSFSQLISLVESLRPSHREKWIWLALRRLNSLRNEFAHNLSLDRLNQKRNEFLESTIPWITPPADTEGLLQFKFVLLILCAQLANIRHGVKTAGPAA
ncbi:MAG: hypothetical protein HS126_12640 [Anaerolineales bacterium]|nr:hypothetical protein [Anaerolineales bacterium]